jgi:hypothetical protein
LNSIKTIVCKQQTDKEESAQKKLSTEEALIAVLAIATFLILVCSLIFLLSVVDGTNITATKVSVGNTFARRWQLLPKHVANFLDKVTPAKVLAVFETDNNSAVSYTDQRTNMYTYQFYSLANKSDLSHKGYSVNDTEESIKFDPISHKKHK